MAAHRTSRIKSPRSRVHLSTDNRTPETTKSGIAAAGVTDHRKHTSNGHPAGKRLDCSPYNESQKVVWYLDIGYCVRTFNNLRFWKDTLPNVRRIPFERESPPPHEAAITQPDGRARRHGRAPHRGAGDAPMHSAPSATLRLGAIDRPCRPTSTRGQPILNHPEPTPTPGGIPGFPPAAWGYVRFQSGREKKYRKS